MEELTPQPPDIQPKCVGCKVAPYLVDIYDMHSRVEQAAAEGRHLPLNHGKMTRVIETSRRRQAGAAALLASCPGLRADGGCPLLYGDIR